MQGSIFGTQNETTGKDSSNNSGAKKKEQINAVEGEKKKYCQHCAKAGKTQRAKTHNSKECYSLPENKDKAPARAQASSGSTSSGNKSGSSAQSGGSSNGNKNGSSTTKR